MMEMVGKSIDDEDTPQWMDNELVNVISISPAEADIDLDEIDLDAPSWQTVYVFQKSLWSDGYGMAVGNNGAPDDEPPVKKLSASPMVDNNSGSNFNPRPRARTPCAKKSCANNQPWAYAIHDKPLFIFSYPGWIYPTNYLI